MWTLTRFADEISPDLAVQIDTLDRASIRYIEFRGVWNKNVLALSDAELGTVKVRLAQRGFGVSSIGSPIGKIIITADFAPHLATLQRAIQVAHTLEASFIRIFSFVIPEADDPARYRELVLERFSQLVRLAERARVTLLHENAKHIYGDMPQRCYDHANSDRFAASAIGGHVCGSKA